MLSMWALVAVAMAFIVWWTMRENNQFSALDFITTDGRGDPQKAAYTGAFIISTWLIWSLTVDGKITEGYYGAYIAAFVLGGAYTATRGKYRAPETPREEAERNRPGI